jgi:hypothetical protein
MFEPDNVVLPLMTRLPVIVTDPVNWCLSVSKPPNLEDCEINIRDPDIPAPTTFKLPLILAEPVMRRLLDIIVETVIFVIPVIIFEPESVVLPLTSRLPVIVTDPVN